MLTYFSTAKQIGEGAPDTLLLPVGSTEQHGAHLPVGTDYLIAGKVGEAVAKRIGAYLLPALPISNCREHKGGKGSIWMNADTLYRVFHDIADSARVQGFKRLVLLVAHGGVFIAGPAIRDFNSANEDMKIIRVELGNIINSKDIKDMLVSENDLHAGEYETSIMLHLFEKYVKKDEIEDCIPREPRDYLNYGTIPQFCKNGVWGMPSLASKEKGAKLFDLTVEKMVEYISDVNRVFDEYK